MGVVKWPRDNIQQSPMKLYSLEFSTAAVSLVSGSLSYFSI
jgi:hypothetical protein